MQEEELSLEISTWNHKYSLDQFSEIFVLFSLSVPLLSSLSHTDLE